MKKFLISFFILMNLSGVLRAASVSFESAVNSSQVSLDEVMQLTLTITGGNDNLDPVSLPVIEGFTAKYLGPSTSVSIINGDYHSERSFVYNLFPNKVGKFQIPPISATISGQTYVTKPIEVEVVENSPQAGPQTASESTDQNKGPTAESLKDKIMVLVIPDETEVYLNERIPLTIKLLINDVPLRDIQYPQFDKSGILVDEFEKPEQGAQLVNGIRYDTVLFKAYIYPNRLGDLTFGPVQIQGNLLYKTGQSNPLNQDNNLFGGDVFNSFFDSYATRPVTVYSQPVQLHVSPMPEDNRPKDFSGAIGQFDFQASVAPLQIKAGDPLTLKMDIKGNGNFKNFKMPVFQALGFKSYAPQIKNNGNEKTAEVVIIPTSADIKEVPSMRFSYFDPLIKDYKTIIQGPFPVQVTAPSPDQEFKAIGFSDVSKEPSIVPSKQFSFDTLNRKFQHLIIKLKKSIWFWTTLVFILVSGILCFIWRRFQERLENDPAFARKIKAVKEAKRALKSADEFIASGKVKDFYALLSKVLRDYLANKWHQSSAALTVEEIGNHLKTAKLDKISIGQVKTILEESDLVCFAGANRDATQMKNDLLQTQNLIVILEQHL